MKKLSKNILLFLICVCTLQAYSQKLKIIIQNRSLGIFQYEMVVRNSSFFIKDGSIDTGNNAPHYFDLDINKTEFGREIRNTLAKSSIINPTNMNDFNVNAMSEISPGLLIDYISQSAMNTTVLIRGTIYIGQALSLENNIIVHERSHTVDTNTNELIISIDQNGDIIFE